MTGNSSGKMGLFAGIGAGILLTGALAASPFYLPMLTSANDKSNQAVAEQVEGLRRTIVAMDEHLSQIADASTARGDAPEVTAKQDELFPPALRAALDDTTKLLNAAKDQDIGRGTEMTATAKIQTGLPNARAAANELRTKHIAAHIKLLSDVESMMQLLKSVEGVSDHLGAVRIQALIAYAKARINQNRAEFERWQAAASRNMALEMAGSMSDLRIRVASLTARMPAEAVSDLEQRIEQLGAQLGVMDNTLGTQTGRIAELKKQAADLDDEASQAREAMAKYVGQAGNLPDEYRTLSDKARDAESRAMALVNGTLDDAVAMQNQSGEIEPPQYKGGSSRQGIRDLEFQAVALSEQVDAMKAIRNRLSGQLDEMKKLVVQLEEEQDALSASLSEQLQRTSELMAESSKHDESARKAEDAALKLFADSGRLAKQAATLGNTRMRDAGDEARKISETTPDERLTRVASDGDTEGSMHALAAEVAYRAAMTQFGRLQAVADRTVAENVLNDKAESEPSAGVSDARKAARTSLNEAVGLYKKAATSIGKTKADSITGKNYLWQVQVGEASVHMLLAAIAESDADAAAEQKLAYDLLTEACKGREQSPLLTPALDALEYLQRSAG